MERGVCGIKQRNREINAQRLAARIVFEIGLLTITTPLSIDNVVQNLVFDFVGIPAFSSALRAPYWSIGNPSRAGLWPDEHSWRRLCQIPKFLTTLCIRENLHRIFKKKHFKKTLRESLGKIIFHKISEVRSLALYTERDSRIGNLASLAPRIFIRP